MNKIINVTNPKMVLLLLILVAIPACLPLIKPGFFPTQDFIHVARLYEMNQALMDGQFPVRWAANFRYGEPTFNFYAPLPFYLGSLIHNLGFTFLDTIKILLGLSFLLSGIAMYFLAKEFWGRVGGFVAATLYIYAPYHSVDVYVRGALSESLALVFFPLIFLASLKLSQKQKPLNIVFLAVSLAGLFFTHNIMTVLFFPVFFGWIVYLLGVNKNWGLVKYFILSTILAIGLASSFLLPAFFEKDLTQSNKMITGYFDFRGHFVEIRQFVSTFWGYGASLWGSEDGMSFQLGWAHLATLILSLGAMLISKKNRSQLVLLIVLTLAFLFSLFMQHNKSTFIWLQFPLLSYTQFPWRFLGISIFLLSLTGGALGEYLRGKWVALAVALIAAVILLNIGVFRPESYYYDSIDAHYVLPSGDKVPKDYLPIWVTDLQRDTLTLPHTVSGEANISNFQKRSVSAQFNVSTLNNVDIEIPITYFPGWKIIANNQIVKPETPNKYGLIRMQLTPGDYLVKLSFEDTNIRRIGNSLSLLSLIVLILLVAAHRKKVRLWIV